MPMNQQNTHTPGPWHVKASLNPSWPDGLAIRPTEGGDVAFIHLGGSEEAKANASLIAAAPELLAALKEAVSQERPDADHYGPKDNGWISRAQAAIKKAEKV